MTDTIKRAPTGFGQPAEQLRQLLRYDPETGFFTNVISRGKKAKTGARSEYPNDQGYLLVALGYQRYRAHRLAWLYMTGEWPMGDVDHINGVRDDNRWTNLRDVSTSTNCENLRRAKKHSQSGLLGVSRHHSGRWAARIMVRGTQNRLGLFNTPEEAHAAYLEAKRQLHEGCTI